MKSVMDVSHSWGGSLTDRHILMLENTVLKWILHNMEPLMSQTLKFRWFTDDAYIIGYQDRLM